MLSGKLDEADRPCALRLDPWPQGRHSPFSPRGLEPQTSLPGTAQEVPPGAARNQEPRPPTWCIFITSWALTTGQMLHSQLISYQLGAAVPQLNE